MANESLTAKPASELAALIKALDITPVEVLEAHLSAIERVNPTLNAIVTLAAESARDAAVKAGDAVMKGEATGVLHGLPVGIKDITPTAGIRTTYGSPLYRDCVPDEDAEVVTRLRNAGAIILAKTNTPEFATGANTFNDVFGMTRNPWNTELSAAGSSGGSAVAVASGMLPLAQGTDFGGSVRVPAAFCGIVGIRPTPGLTPNYPMPLAWDPGQVHGPLARTAEDAALMLDAMVGFSTISPISVQPPWSSAAAAVKAAESAKGVRIAYVSDLSGIGIDSELEEICRKAILGLKDAGAQVEEIAFDASDGKAPYYAWRGLWMVGQQYRHLDRLEHFGPNLQGNVKSGLTVTTADLGKAEQARAALYARFRQLFQRYDILITPQSPVKQFPVVQNFPTEVNGKPLENYLDWIASSFLITLMSLPAGSVPVGKTADGLPVGVQVISTRFQEPRILSLCKIIQRAYPIGWPPIPPATGIHSTPQK